MPIDLVGKLHRTVYVCNCPQGSLEDLATLMMRRCGAVEAWEVLDERLVIVFQSLNSVSTALAFHGISFVDLTKKLVVWRAKDPPPADASQQLALTGEGVGRSEEEDAARVAWLEKRRERKATLHQLASEVELLEKMEVANREEKMSEWCFRQAKALNIILEDAVEKAKAELYAKQEVLETTQRLCDSMCRKREREE